MHSPRFWPANTHKLSHGPFASKGEGWTIVEPHFSLAVPSELLEAAVVSARGSCLLRRRGIRSCSDPMPIMGGGRHGLTLIDTTRLRPRGRLEIVGRPIASCGETLAETRTDQRALPNACRQQSTVC
jgi:hypothetical protein